ncbi:hypothetical protein PHPALM_28441 [Phytophthora palmivora]|uniref:RxLR effector protein n=1 Tax=Phytophthora palmivora TaxID=4796 RepID=A0A2P4XA55_9STRA|nr:hypothetical protein PHPALM_28441 [Phytophthora palmivora]
MTNQPPGLNSQFKISPATESHLLKKVVMRICFIVLLTAATLLSSSGAISIPDKANVAKVTIPDTDHVVDTQTLIKRSLRKRNTAVGDEERAVSMVASLERLDSLAEKVPGIIKRFGDRWAYRIMQYNVWLNMIIYPTKLLVLYSSRSDVSGRNAGQNMYMSNKKAKLVPGNTKRAKATAVGSFVKFLKSEGVPEEYVRVDRERDGGGKFGMYLAFNEGKKGKPLARNTAMQYYRPAKRWLLDQFPRHWAALGACLLKMGNMLDNSCLKRDCGCFLSKAPPCLKADMKKMLAYLCVNASCSSDYQDAALLCLLWYLFDRASDLALLHKPDISIDAGTVLFIHFIRMKTSEEQGLSLLPGTKFERWRC